MTTLALRFLGPMEFHWDDQPRPKPATRKAQSLLAYLVTHRDRPQLRDKLADLYWGEWSERKARRSLTTALWRIRHCLPDDAFLQADPHTVQFVPPEDFWLDVEAFEDQVARGDLTNLQAAVALCRGDFLAGFYDDWIVTERFRLEALLCEALACLMVEFEQRDEHEAALATTLRLLEHNPLQEDAHRLAMRAYCRLGHQHQALEQYRRCQETLQQELGIEPMAETAELYEAIRAGRFPLGPVPEVVPVPVPAAVRPVTPTGRSPLDVVAPGPLVGREPELAFLHQRWSAALAGSCGLALVGGEAGVGKTRLVEEFAHQVRWQGARVLWGRCYEFERLLPYQPVAEALRTLGPAELADVPAETVAEVARLMPETLQVTPHPASAAPDAIAPEQEQARLFGALARLLAVLSAREPLLVVLEDLHWATGSTLQLLHYLTRHLADGLVLLVGTFRTELARPGHPLRTLQRQLGREELAFSLDLARLSPAATAELVLALSGAGEATMPLAQRLYQETLGNPFFLMEIVKALFTAGTLCVEGDAWQGDWSRLGAAELPLPASVRAAIEGRVLRLSADAQALLPLAAVAGREFDLNLLQALWGRDTDATLEALDDLLRHRLVDEGIGALGRDYAFTHHKIQEVVYAGLPRRRRQHLHARVGVALEAVYTAEVSELAGELAFHFQQARQLDPSLTGKAIAYLLQAGDQARLAYAHPEAVDYYQRTLALLKQQGDYEQAARTLMKLGLTYHNAFDFPAARQAYDEGFALWQQARKAAPTVLPPAPHAFREAWVEPPTPQAYDEGFTLDPTVAGDGNDAAWGWIIQLFSGLVELRPDWSIVPDVARSWEVSANGRQYVFHLRDDVRWSDSALVTAGDFEYAWKRALDPATRSPLAFLLYDVQGAQAFHQGEVSEADHVGVQARDASTLVVELEGPTGYFLNLLAACPVTYPVPRRVVEAHGAAWTEPDHFVTNGPFQVESWRQGRPMTLRRNPTYHGRFRGNVERMERVIVPSWTVELEMYEADNLDISSLWGLLPSEMDWVRQRPARDYDSGPSLATTYIGFNTKRPPFDDVRVRQAFVLATDRETLANVILNGFQLPATGGFVPPGIPGHSAGIALPYDPDRARWLLAQAGYAPGGSQRFPDVNAWRPGDEMPVMLKTGEYLRMQWRENLGVEIAREPGRDWTTYQAQLRRESPHMFGMVWVPDYLDPDSFLRQGVPRETGWRNETYDKLVEKARRIVDQEQRMRLYGQADRILVEEAPLLILWYQRYHRLVKPWVRPVSPFTKWSLLKDVVIEPH